MAMPLALSTKSWPDPIYTNRNNWLSRQYDT